jgi:dehydratase
MKHTHSPIPASAKRPLAVVALAVVALAGLSAFGLTTGAQATATGTSVTYDAKASALGQTGEFTVNTSVSGTAPSTVAADSSLAVTLSVGSINVPTSADGFTVTEIKGIALKMPVPANATYDSAGVTGGSDIGSGTPTVSESGGVITINVPGPISAGTTFTLPTLTLRLTSGAAGGTIDTTLSGAGHSAPGLTFTAVLSFLGFGINARSVGYPTTSPTLTSTTIS